MELKVAVTPNSKKLKVVKVSESEYRVRVDAPAVEGKANRRLIEIMSEYFKVPKASVNILKGLKSKNKIVEIDL